MTLPQILSLVVDHPSFLVWHQKGTQHLLIRVIRYTLHSAAILDGAVDPGVLNPEVKDEASVPCPWAKFCLKRQIKGNIRLKHLPGDLPVSRIQNFQYMPVDHLCLKIEANQALQLAVTQQTIQMRIHGQPIIIEKEFGHGQEFCLLDLYLSLLSFAPGQLSAGRGWTRRTRRQCNTAACQRGKIRFLPQRRGRIQSRFGNSQVDHVYTSLATVPGRRFRIHPIHRKLLTGKRVVPWRWN